MHWKWHHNDTGGHTFCDFVIFPWSWIYKITTTMQLWPNNSNGTNQHPMRYDQREKRRFVWTTMAAFQTWIEYWIALKAGKDVFALFTTVDVIGWRQTVTDAFAQSTVEHFFIFFFLQCLPFFQDSSWGCLARCLCNKPSGVTLYLFWWGGYDFVWVACEKARVAHRGETWEHWSPDKMCQSWAKPPISAG